MWITAIIAAASALVGVVLGQTLSAAREHVNWVNDQKRLEYRQLLDQLYQTVTAVSDIRPNLNHFDLPSINEAVKPLSRAFADRIFIADELRDVRAIDDWLEMKKVIYYEPALESSTPNHLRFSLNNLHTREDKLREKILDSAKKNIVKLKFFRLRP